MITEPRFIRDTMFSVTTTGALAPAIRTAPIRTSAYPVDFSMAEGLD
jgi:hypothetical protein